VLISRRRQGPSSILFIGVLEASGGAIDARRAGAFEKWEAMQTLVARTEPSQQYCRQKGETVTDLRVSYRAVLPTLLITERTAPLFGFGFFISAIAIADRRLPGYAPGDKVKRLQLGRAFTVTPCQLNDPIGMHSNVRCSGISDIVTTWR
jgi:hypothetical protein